MKFITLNQAKEIEFNGLSVALGTFDGLHIGHMALIDAVKRSSTSAVFTFDSLPIDLFCEDHRPMRLFTLDEKIEAFKKSGIDYLCTTHFDHQFADMDKDDFATLIKTVFTPQRVVAGYNYTYGRHAEGNAHTLSKYGSEHGFEVDVIPPVIFDGEPVSSTRVRDCITAGRIKRANELLGYDYFVSGPVSRGAGLGTQLGFPTANISVAKEKILPQRGVYSVDVKIGDKKYKGLCNIGIKPTVSDDRNETVEVYIVALSEDLYGRNISVFFNKRLRDEKKFNSTEELKAQIRRDVTNI